MTPSQAKRIVVFGITLAALITVFEEITKPEIPKLRIAFGALFAAVFLSLVADVAPKVAAGLATLVAVSTVLSQGSLLTKISNYLGGTK
jgi:hypothetical protein